MTKTFGRRLRNLEDLELLRQARLRDKDDGWARRQLLEKLRKIRERLQPAIDRGEWVPPAMTVQQATEMVRGALEAPGVRREENERQAARSDG